MRVALDFGSTNTGLTPTLSVWQRLDTFADVATPPTLTEIVAIPGMYWFDWAPAPGDPDMVYIADAGAGAPDATQRYKRGSLLVKDTLLDASIAGVKTDLAAVKAVVDGLATAVADLQTSATGIDGKVDTVTTNVGAVKTELDGVASDLTVVKGDTSAYAAQGDTIYQTEQGTQGMISGSVMGALTTLQTAVDAITPAVQGSGGKSLTDIDTKLGAGNISTAIAAVKAVVDGFATTIDLTPLVSAVSAMQATVTGMNTTIAGVDSEVGNMVTTVTAFAAALQRALGMLHENSVLDKCVYTDNNDLKSARLRVYDSKDHSNAAAAALPDDYDTGKLAEYVIKASYNGANLTTYLMTREFPLT